MIVKRVGPWSVAKMCFVLYGLIGLILGATFALTATYLSTWLGLPPSNVDRPLLVMGLSFGTAAVVILPIFYAVAGFIGGLIVALLYNLVAGIVGGVEMDVQ